MTKRSQQVFIRKGGYFYRPNWCGYTSSSAEAGRYDRGDATAHSLRTEGVTVHEIADWDVLPPEKSAEAAKRMRQTYEVTGDKWFKIAADQLDAAVMAKTRLDDFADKANAGQVHYSARELKRKIGAAFADFDAAGTEGLKA